MKKYKTMLFSILINFLFYFICFFVFKPNDTELLGWVILFLYIIIPLTTILYLTIITANLNMNLLTKAILYIFNVVLFFIFIYNMFGYIGDSFTCVLVLIPSGIGLLIGSLIYEYRMKKIISIDDTKNY